MSACRVMETRTCPPAGPCAGPCARFESDDPGPWLARMTGEQLRELERQVTEERRSRECSDFLPGHRACDMGGAPHTEHGYTMWNGSVQVRVTWRAVVTPRPADH